MEAKKRHALFVIGEVVRAGRPSRPENAAGSIYRNAPPSARHDVSLVKSES
jgi:hypothetical protein